EARNPGVNAVVSRLYDEARAAIERGLPEGPFAGVPYLLKDLSALYAGAATTFGCALFRDAVADHDSEMVARLKRAGLVIFGKTNTSELGLSTSTEPRLYGPTRNPWNAAFSAGGSSGGAAAAVASGMLPMAHATDGGGSIRIPASACGLFGLKPTRARNPSGPDVGEGWNGASAQHAVTRSVRDSAALLDATSGPDIGDPYWAPPPQRPFLAEIDADPGRLRIAVTATAWNGKPVDPECVDAVARASSLLESLGHEVSEARPSWDESQRQEATRLIAAAHTRAALAARAKALGRAPRPEDVEPPTWLVAEIGREAGAADYARAITVAHGVGRAVGRFFTRYDILLTPTMCRPPHRLGVLGPENPDGAAYLDALLGTIAFTSPFNTSGNPAMSMPLHRSRDGLPIGVQLVAGFGAEATLFRLAAQIERAAAWTGARPAG
ncbi:MAG TPA: amidase, partial [Stellaceae bacterium]|nr:amidase [Stellaceae bacterium]